MRSTKSDLLIYHVDDEPNMRESFRNQLDATPLGKGCKLASFATAEGFLSHIVNISQPSLVVLDYFLVSSLYNRSTEDRVTGRDLAGICRSMFPGLGIVMRTSLYDNYDDPEEQRIVRAFGADRFIPKDPFFNRLEEALLKTLKERDIKLCA